MSEIQPTTPPSRLERFSRKKREPWVYLYWVAGLLLLACIATVVYVIHLSGQRFDEVLDQISEADGKEISAEESAKVKPLAILLLGIDARPQLASLNTDVIMAIAVNPETKAGTVVSIPRDTYIPATMGFRANKANAFYANFYVDDKDTAMDKIKQLFGDLLGIRFDYAVTVNFQALVDVVDALGGVDVYVDMDMRYVDRADGTNINLKKGQQVLDGKQTLDFVRYRKSHNGSTAESSDFERNQRQQQVIKAILNKLMTPSGMTKINSLIEAVGNNVRTDMPKEQIKDFITTYMSIDMNNVNMIPLEGTWKSPYIYLKDGEWDRASQALQETLKSSKDNGNKKNN